MIYVRTCQECGNKQTSDSAPPYRVGEDGLCDLDDPEFECVCRRCRSPALDYGSWGD